MTSQTCITTDRQGTYLPIALHNDRSQGSKGKGGKTRTFTALAAYLSLNSVHQTADSLLSASETSSARISR